MTAARPAHVLEKEDAYLKRAWVAGVPTEQIAERLNRPLSYVGSRASNLNVKRPEWYKAELRVRHGKMAQGIIPCTGHGEDRPSGHRMSEQAIAELYAGRRYESVTTQDNTTGRLPLPSTFVARANALASVA